MNARQTYLAWVRTNYPRLYYTALNQTFSPRSGLSGLGDDLVDSITPDATSALDIPVSSDVTDSVNAAYNAAIQEAPSNSGDTFSALASAISSIGTTVVQTQAESNLLKINTQRAMMGLPLYNSNGQIVTGSMLAPTNATIAQMEAALSGSGSILPIVLIGGAAVLFALMASR